MGIKKIEGFPYPNVKLSVGVWDCTFYVRDDEGFEILNDDGTIKMFHAPDLDWSHVAELVELDDLEEVYSGR
jgi:hypothetical protein|tara:strand:+ start:437 stop:652 length:216 start_codon:yes stop_codon:yes gene_type:complete